MFLNNFNGRCFVPFVADGMATLVYADCMADVIAIGGRWNSHFCEMQPIWQMLLPVWYRWTSHLGWFGVLADGIANCQH